MRKLYLTMIIALCMFVNAGESHAILYANELITPNYSYEVDTFMENSEIYEFVPKISPRHRCVVFVLDSLSGRDSASIACFEVENEGRLGHVK